METKKLATENKPYLTHKYSRKIRLLLTNRCERNCSFCHNEGMAKEQQQYMDINQISAYFGEFKKISNRIVLTGGEPLLFSQLHRLVYELEEYGFDITIDTAISKLSGYYSLLYRVKDIHISFLDYNNCNDFIKDIEELLNNVPSVQVVINVPLYNEDAILKVLPYIKCLAQIHGVRLQLIKIFNPNIKNNQNWHCRWSKILKAFHYENLYLIDATERECSFITQNHNLVDFIDIPCEFAGEEFSKNSCLNEMDITITPNLYVQFCRWSLNTAYPLSRPETFFKDVCEALKKSMDYCMCGGAENELFSKGLPQYAIKKHYVWPPSSSSFLWKIDQQINCSQTSYFGKEGYIRYFENTFARYIGVSYALSLCSGAAAFYIACMAIGITEKSKVVLPVYSYPGLITALIHLKAQVILCDVEPDTGNISLEAFEKLACPEISAVVITHLWGKPVDIFKFQELCISNNIYIIEDGSHAFGAKINNKRIGNIGDIAFFSLQSNKVIYAGEGGIITTNKREFYEKAIMYSMLKKRILDCVINKNLLMDDETGWGLKLKLNPLGAIMANYSLEKITEINRLRKKNFSVFSGIISGNVMFEFQTEDSNSERVFYTFKLLLAKKYVDYRNLLVDRLIRRGLEVTISSFRPLHRLHITQTYLNADAQLKSYPNADYYAERIISFPSFTYEERRLVEFYAKVVIEEAKRLMEENV